MSDRFRKRCTASLIASLIAIGGAAPWGSAQAQALRDPTRPPAQYLDQADALAEESAAPSGLQTIKRTGKRRAALLHGAWVKPGDKLGEAVVGSIDEQSVTLKYPDGRRETIRMYPEVDVQSSRAVKRVAGR